MQTMLNAIAGIVPDTIGGREVARLHALASYRPLALVDQPSIKRILKLVSMTFDVPIVSIQVLTETTVVRLAAVSDCELPEQQRSRSITFQCLAAGAPVMVPDLPSHPVLRENALVVTRGCRSAAAYPLYSATGLIFGSVSIWDRRRREFSAHQIEMLGDFAEIVNHELSAQLFEVEAAKKAALLQAAFDNPAVGVAVYRKTGERVAVNKKYCSITNRSSADLLGKTAAELMSHDDFAEFSRIASRVLEGEIETAGMESALSVKGGQSLWCKTLFGRIVSPDTGEPVVITFIEDEDDRRRAEQSRKLLLGEINHRVKNTLAIVQGIARQLMRTPSGEGDFNAAFENRVQALARSHDMLTQVSWEPLPLSSLLGQLIGGTWEPYRDRFDISTSTVALNSQSTVMLWLLFGELLTNSVKHGALKHKDGRVSINAGTGWKKGRTWLKVVWKETGVPNIAQPTRKGLGLYLLDRAPKLGLSGSGSVQFEPDGLRFTIEFPVFDKDDIGHRALVG